MLVDFENISRNLNMHKYSLIGSGSGRLVYDLDNGYVVKVAKNKKGIVQNKAEHEISTMSKSGLLAKVIAISENSHYLIMEKAERIRSISLVWEYYKVNSNHELYRVPDIKELYKNYHLLYGDLGRKSSWGFMHGRLVIIDFGFTKETRRYYTIF